MKTFKVEFVGRKLGAIGITYPIQTKVTARDAADAIDALYKRYEHISGLRFKVKRRLERLTDDEQRDLQTD